MYLGHYVMMYVFRSLDSSHSITSPLSSTHSSQDSLHKSKKKGGIKTSLGRIFSKKDRHRGVAGKDVMSPSRTDEAPPPDVTSKYF